MKTLAELFPRDPTIPAVPIGHLVFDSREVQPGCLFVALTGTSNDGHEFIPEAIKRGAAAILAERDPGPVGVPVILRPNTRRELSRLADVFYDHPSRRLKLVGITGTKGKTTITYLMQAILQRHFGPTLRLGTVEYDLGFTRRPARNTTPESAQIAAMLAEAHQHRVKAGVMEVSSHALCTYRVEDIRFAAVGFTNLSLEHTEFHSSMEEYYSAKERLFLELRRNTQPAVVMIDDDWGLRLAQACRDRWVPLVTVSLDRPEADLHAAEIGMGARGTDFVVCRGAERHRFHHHLVGRFNVRNALLAIGLARSLGIPWPVIQQGLLDVAVVPGRFETVSHAGEFLVVVDYAHSPAALENVLQTARPLTAGRLITVFGCGGNRSREKRPEMGRIAALNSDVCIITSDNPRQEDPQDIIAQIVAGIEPLPPGKRAKVSIEVDRREAIGQAIRLAGPKDTIIIAGKGHETGQTFADHTVPFDDREVAASFLHESTHRRQEDTHVVG
jgi:UDP-N-acetylmuramoyl-L-alanyl-D-glutamate--2,6-diaminopimelate ligase